MPTIDQYNELNLKIADAKAERDSLFNSLNNPNQPGGSWKDSLKNNCGVTWQPNTQPPGLVACGANEICFKNDGKINCLTIWNLITSRTNRIIELDKNIKQWEAEATALLKDPTIEQQIKDQQLNRRLKIAGIALAITAAVIAIIYWGYKKYKK